MNTQQQQDLARTLNAENPIFSAKNHNRAELTSMFLEAQELLRTLAAENYAFHEKLQPLTNMETGVTKDNLDYCREYLAKLEAENAALRAAQEWQPIETAPRDETVVLLWWPSAYGGKGGAFTGLFIDGRWKQVNAWDITPTLWRTIAAPAQAMAGE